MMADAKSSAFFTGVLLFVLIYARRVDLDVGDERGKLLHSKLNRKHADGERMRPWHVKVTVSGRVARVRARLDGGWRVRLSDTGGALGAAEIRPWNPLPLPPQGARIILRGRVHYDEEHGWYVVDPLEHWQDAADFG